MRQAVAFLFVVPLIALSADGLRAAYDEPTSCPQLPALTGDVTTSVGSCVTTDTFHKISTQSGSAVASLAWTGLGATYNNYLLSCYGLLTTTASTNLYLQFGEGGTPTWETATYQWSGMYNSTASGSAGASGNASTSDSGLLVAVGSSGNTVTGSSDWTVFIYDVPSTTRYTSANWQSLNSVTPAFIANGAGRYTGDTNAKTAIRLFPASGTMTGACTLWGMLQP